ncbi:MAG: RluA family pseudouridine synthase [Faecalibacterium sp.]
MKHFTATENDTGVRLSRFVQSVTLNMPNSLLYKSFRNKRIKVNGKKADAETRLQAGDLIELYINDEFFATTTATTSSNDAQATGEHAASPITIKPTPAQQPNVTVIFEDDNIAVLYKPAGLLCHSDITGDANLVDAFIAYLITQGSFDPAREQRFKPSICNRLDRGTEGLVIAAKNYATLRDMNEIIRTDCLKKEYYTITIGTPRVGRFTAWWSHNEALRKVSIHANQDSKKTRKNIITDIDVLKVENEFSLCKIGLITGRTHQIRAHLAYLGKPVLGDIKYGNRAINQKTGTKTQALCAAKISFSHIPAQNTLAYLNGKVIKLKDPQILKQFEALTQT